LDELENFYNDNFDILGTAQRATEAAIATTEDNVQWMTNNGDAVSAWFAANAPPSARVL